MSSKRKSTAFCTIQQSLQVLLTPFDVRTDDDVNWNLRLTAPMMQRCQSLQMAVWQKTVVDAIHFELGVSINVQNLHGPQAVRCHPWSSPMNVQCPGIASCGLRSPFQVSLWVQGKTCKTLVPWENEHEQLALRSSKCSSRQLLAALRAEQPREATRATLKRGWWIAWFCIQFINQ